MLKPVLHNVNVRLEKAKLTYEDEKWVVAKQNLQQREIQTGCTVRELFVPVQIIGT